MAIRNIKAAHGRGEENHNSKKTKKSVASMRESFKKNPSIKMADLGSLFGVGRETARKVIKEIIW